MATTKDSEERTLLVSSLWLHGGFIGAAAAGAGVLRWCTGDLGSASAFGLVFLGALVAAACWRRGWVVLRNAMRQMTPCEAASVTCELGNASCTSVRKVGRPLFEGETV